MRLPRGPCQLTPLLFVAWLIASPGRAWSPACPEGNLLAGRLPLGESAALAAVTDGRVGPEGALWSAGPAVVLDAATPELTWDLGLVAELTATPS